MEAIREIGCVACIVADRIQPFTVPAEHTAIHHIDGQRKPGAHFFTIPLCPGCHQHNDDARHINKKIFVETYGTEKELLEKTKEILAQGHAL